MHNLNCFKAYDIRGRVPDDLSYDLAYDIGRAYGRVVNPGAVVVGYDVRLESPALAQRLMEGLTDEGVDVIHIGLCGTEEVYFHTFHRGNQGVGGGIMITASHNPKGYNGMKMVRENAMPISGDSGLLDIRDMVSKLPPVSGQKGQVVEDFNKDNYIQHLLTYVDVQALKPLKIIVNPGNGGAGPIIRLLEKYLPFEFIYIHDEPDGNFPHGVPNPLLEDARASTADAVRDHGADMGLAWDGDFDRCFFFSENGEFIEGYYIVGLLAEAFLKKTPGGKVIHDPRLIWNTIDVAEKGGGQAIECKTGHAFIKERMRAEDAVYGGEMSAHHYFKDFAYCDSGMIPWLLVAELMCTTGKPISRMVEERIQAFPCSGEKNYRVEDQQKTMARLLEHYQSSNPVISEIDGLSMAWENWRMNVRQSNTEPYLRLNIESRGDKGLVQAKVEEVEKLILG